MSGPRLVATCWTSAGSATPLVAPELSPFDPIERIRAVAETGWAGFGLGQDDLRAVASTIGFDALRREADALGLEHAEVELASGWWLADEAQWRPTWELLLEAAAALDARFIKVGTAFGEPVGDLTPFVAPMRRLADEAAAVGTRVALEPLPFALVASMPQGADLVRLVDHPAAGLVVDFWHVFRAGTSLAELAERVPVEAVFGVELSDARAAVVGTLFEDTRDNRTLLMQGEQDVAGFIRTMRDLGYQGAWGVEILSDEHRARGLREGLAAAHASALDAFAAADTI